MHHAALAPFPWCPPWRRGLKKKKKKITKKNKKKTKNKKKKKMEPLQAPCAPPSWGLWTAVPISGAVRAELPRRWTAESLHASCSPAFFPWCPPAPRTEEEEEENDEEEEEEDKEEEEEVVGEERKGD